MKSTLMPLLEPLERAHQLHERTVRRHGRRTIDLSFPNPRFLANAEPLEALANTVRLMDAETLRYSPFGGFTTPRRHTAQWLSSRQHLPYTWRDVLLTAGATGALTLAFGLLDPGDQVMLLTPCWMDYPLYAAHAGLDVQLVRTTFDKRPDLAAIEAAWTPRTRALVIAQPSSPTGVVLTTTETTALAELLHHLTQLGDPPLLISDEAHRDQVWAPVTCPSPAFGYPRALTVHSFGKAWDMQGQRLGFLAVHPGFPDKPETLRTLERLLRVHGQCAPNALSQHLATHLAGWEPDPSPLAQAQHAVRTALTAAGVDVVDAAATRFVYCRSPRADATQFVTRLADEHGLLVLPSDLFHEPGHFRLSLNYPTAELAPALGILATEARTRD